MQRFDSDPRTVNRFHWALSHAATTSPGVNVTSKLRWLIVSAPACTIMTAANPSSTSAS